MKKLFILILSFLLFVPVLVNAESCNKNDIVVVEVQNEENETVESSDNKINLDFEFYDPGDSVEYTITLKNNSQEDIILDDNSLNISSDYVTYTIVADDNDYIIGAGEEKVVKLIITYKNKAPEENFENNEYNKKDTVTLDFFQLINPKTGVDNPIINYTIALCSIIILFYISITIMFKKQIKYPIFLLCIFFALPLAIDALCEYHIDVESDITFINMEAVFLPGPEVNVKMKELAGMSSPATTTVNTNVLSIKYSSDEPSNENKEDKNIVSTDDSPYEIYMWFDDGTIYWWSEDKKPSLNPDASSMFTSLTMLTDISGLHNFDASKSTTLSAMFKRTALETLKPLEGWDVSNVTDLSNIFYTATNLTNFEGLENWDVSNVTNMDYTFANCQKITSLKALSKWNTSNVESMEFTFAALFVLEDLEGLEDWNVSKVESMYCLFLRGFKIKSLVPLSKWKPSSVKNMVYIFAAIEDLESLEGLENWDVSAAEDLTGAFAMGAVEHGEGHICKLKDITALKKWDTGNVKSIHGLFQACEELEDANGLEDWDTSSLTLASSLFTGCISLKDVSSIYNWTLPKLNNVNSMFRGCASLEEIDFSNFDFSGVTNHDSMLKETSSLKRIKTPKAYSSTANINLYKTFYDEDNNQYTSLDSSSPTETWLSIPN